MCHEFFCIKKLPKMGAIFACCSVCFSVQKIKLLQKKFFACRCLFNIYILKVLKSFRGARDRTAIEFFIGGRVQNYKSSL